MSEPADEYAPILRREWIDLIGAHRPEDAAWRVTERGDGALGRRIVLELQSYGARLEGVLLLPGSAAPSAVVIVPFYDVESLLGHVSRLYPDVGARPTRAFAREIAAAGLGVLAVPWWAEAAARPAASLDLHERYGPAALHHLERHPHVTGLGRSVADLLLSIDALEQLDEVDSARIGVFGHSLGGKLALFAAALDPRIRAAVSHEPGLGFAHSNWSDTWYLGSRVPADRDLDEVLRLVSPRPILYAGGGAADGEHNEELVRSATSAGSRVEILRHGGGHPLPEDVLATMIDWLRARLARSA
ncbi:acetylxylan esterase [Microbacterium sp.]|uniref:alpha/beta hydrolase family protein n=1 Tax=Microbacterium sp. TaxID=51671 RepID=UPI0028116234|nr:acetylxylan esterase [Microbacterium sp.]